MDTFGGRLHAAMLAAGMDSPEPLAKLCGVSVRTFLRWMMLEKGDLSAELAYKLARALNVRLGWLLDGEPPMHLTDVGREAVGLIEKMSEPQALRFLAYGRRLLRNG